MCFFGGVWLLLGAHRQPRFILYAVVILLATIALAVHIQSLQEGRQRNLTGQYGKDKTRTFLYINLVQWLLILSSPSILQSVGHAELLIPVVMGIVALHFFPLAALFRYRAHYVTGALLLLLAIASGVFGPGNPVGPTLAGIVLWCSALFMLHVAPTAD